jgi:ABC-type bacteriocin/lantibiotic exporter with double-glycine peptidase domain
VAQRAREAADLKNRSDNLLVEITTKRDVILDGDMTDPIRNRAGELYNRYLVARFRSQQLEAALQSWSQAIVGVAGIGVLGLGALRVIEETMTTGALVAMMAVVWRVLYPIQTVCLSLYRLQQFVTTLGQIDQLMKMKGDTSESAGRTAPRRFDGALRLKDVTLRYPGRLDFGLKAVTLDVPSGALIAISGSSGSGKSTLLKVALGLYPVQAGRITIDGIDLRQLDGRELRQATYFLPQDPVLFYGTVAQNVRLTAPDATDDEVAAALSAFGVRLPHPLLPEGYETRIGGLIRRQSAAGLSQRIALAAAFARPRPLILLDCPAQHLDAEGDQMLRQALERAKRRATVLMVTQRPSHMALADRVVLMHDGEVVGQGPPAALVPRILAQMQRGTHAA